MTGHDSGHCPRHGLTPLSLRDGPASPLWSGVTMTLSKPCAPASHPKHKGAQSKGNDDSSLWWVLRRHRPSTQAPGWTACFGQWHCLLSAEYLRFLICKAGIRMIPWRVVVHELIYKPYAESAWFGPRWGFAPHCSSQMDSPGVEYWWKPSPPPPKSAYFSA